MVIHWTVKNQHIFKHVSDGMIYKSGDSARSYLDLSYGHVRVLVHTNLSAEVHHTEIFDLLL